MRSSVLALLLFFLAAIGNARSDYNYDMQSGGEISREQVIRNMERRKKQLETLLAETKKSIANHHSGVETLELEEKEKLEKRIEIINKKLERMEDVDEREIERMQRREQRRWERRRDREL